MRSRSAPIVLGCMLLPCFAVAAETPTLESKFERLCANNQARPELVVAAARNQGWVEISASEAPPPPNGFEFVSAFVKKDEVGVFTVLDIYHGVYSLKGVTVSGNLCRVATQSGAGAPLTDISKWAGVPGAPGSPAGRAIYVFTDDPSGHKPLTYRDEQQMLTLVHDGRLALVTVTEQGSGALIAYFHSQMLSADVHPH